MPSAQVPDSPLEALTPKQREVLDLLIQHKTSKEISRILGISPYTVDQRILLARGKLQVATRSEVAQAYRALVEQEGYQGDPVSQRPVYGLPDIATDLRMPHQDGEERDAAQAGTNGSEREPAQSASIADPGSGEVDHRVLPEMFDGRYGTLMRLGATALIAMILILTVLGGLTLFAQLSHIVDR
jgi:DNA-binding CsgD family transcriptional regulator